MTVLTADSLKEAMRLVAHDPDLAVDSIDTEFGDLDFDSLAVLELVTRVQKEYAITVPDSVMEELSTPRDLLDYVTKQLEESTS
ncbi:act minimal PKS acyl carrier protein [Nocardia transvalensis]|uniref:Act minimal PKS acyl carrier protein n=1 Tax=Nocardia transvalensis TaxID=37333 RepID=A0A7W9PLP7_9NOCA|nr:acyl carrier protein [Nocardia transvalensis]MBB5918327.1 act minimal PKS acyl carrier protein [Nocardia transvalensis]